jgi:hypothetical protein
VYPIAATTTTAATAARRKQPKKRQPKKRQNKVAVAAVSTTTANAATTTTTKIPPATPFHHFHHQENQIPIVAPMNGILRAPAAMMRLQHLIIKENHQTIYSCGNRIIGIRSLGLPMSIMQREKILMASEPQQQLPTTRVTNRMNNCAVLGGGILASGGPTTGAGIKKRVVVDD